MDNNRTRMCYQHWSDGLERMHGGVVSVICINRAIVTETIILHLIQPLFLKGQNIIRPTNTFLWMDKH